MIGNAVACIAVARWENAIDRDRMRLVLSGKYDPEDEGLEGMEPTEGAAPKTVQGKAVAGKPAVLNRSAHSTCPSGSDPERDLPPERSLVLM